MSLEEYILGKLDKLEGRIRQFENEANEQHKRINDIDGAYVDTDWFTKILAKICPESEEDSWWEDV